MSGLWALGFCRTVLAGVNFFRFYMVDRKGLFPSLLKYIYTYIYIYGFPGGAMVKNPPVSAGDARDRGSFPGWRRSPE